MLSDHIEREVKFLKKRDAIKRELLQREDFIKSKAFKLISNDKEEIELSDLVEFLKKNNFRAAREDLEAILRRIDHTGD